MASDGTVHNSIMKFLFGVNASLIAGGSESANLVRDAGATCLSYNPDESLCVLRESHLPPPHSCSPHWPLRVPAVMY